MLASAEPRRDRACLPPVLQLCGCRGGSTEGRTELELQAISGVRELHSCEQQLIEYLLGIDVLCRDHSMRGFCRQCAYRAL